jgi:hypothetical protein
MLSREARYLSSNSSFSSATVEPQQLKLMAYGQTPIIDKVATARKPSPRYMIDSIMISDPQPNGAACHANAVSKFQSAAS